MQLFLIFYTAASRGSRWQLNQVKVVEKIRSQSSSSGSSLVHENAPQGQGQEILIQEEEGRSRPYNETIEFEFEVQDQDSNSMAEPESLQEEPKSNQLTIANANSSSRELNNETSVEEKSVDRLSELNRATVEPEKSKELHDSRQLNNETVKQDNSTDSLFTRLVRGFLTVSFFFFRIFGLNNIIT